jgi:hypothetical protein
MGLKKGKAPFLKCQCLGIEFCNYQRLVILNCEIVKTDVSLVRNGAILKNKRIAQRGLIVYF